MFTLDVGNLKPLTAGIIIVGHTNGPPFPLNLSFMQMPNCNLLVNWLVNVGIFTVAGGTASWSTLVPNDPRFVGGEFYNQAWVLDPAANLAGIATSNGGKGVIGN